MQRDVVYEHADVMLRDRHFRRRCGAYNTHIYMPQRRAVNAPTEQLMQSILSNGHYVRNAPPIEYRACKINLPCWVHLTEISVWRLVLGRSRFHYACLVHLINGVVPHSRGPPDQETSSSALPAARLRLNWEARTVERTHARAQNTRMHSRELTHTDKHTHAETYTLDKTHTHTQFGGALLRSRASVPESAQPYNGKCPRRLTANDHDNDAVAARTGNGRRHATARDSSSGSGSGGGNHSLIHHIHCANARVASVCDCERASRARCERGTDALARRANSGRSARRARRARHRALGGIGIGNRDAPHRAGRACNVPIVCARACRGNAGYRQRTHANTPANHNGGRVACQSDPVFV